MADKTVGFVSLREPLPHRGIVLESVCPGEVVDVAAEGGLISERHAARRQADIGAIHANGVSELPALLGSLASVELQSLPSLRAGTLADRLRLPAVGNGFGELR